MIKRIDIVNYETTGPVATQDGDSGKVSGYCLWEYQQGQWILKKDASKDGFEPSSPPVESGAFDGQLRAVLCEPQPAFA